VPISDAVVSFDERTVVATVPLNKFVDEVSKTVIVVWKRLDADEAIVVAFVDSLAAEDVTLPKNADVVISLPNVVVMLNSPIVVASLFTPNDDDSLLILTIDVVDSMAALDVTKPETDDISNLDVKLFAAVVSFKI